jgi:hypothetical protein
MSKVRDDTTTSIAHDDWGPVTTVIVWGGRLLAILSAFMLVHEAFTVSLSAPFVRMFGWYDAGVQFIGEFLRPLMETVVELLVGWFPGIQLNPDWKHGLAIAGGIFGSLIPAMYALHGRTTIQRSFFAINVAIMFASLPVFLFVDSTRPSLSFATMTLTLTQERILIGLAVLLLLALLFWVASRRRVAALTGAVPIGVLFLVVTNAGLGIVGL